MGNVLQVSAVTLNVLHEDTLHPGFHQNLKRFTSEVNGDCGNEWDDLHQMAHIDGLDLSRSCGEQYQNNPCSIT